MSLKVTTDIQCDADGCTTTADVNTISSFADIKTARAEAKAAGWTCRTGIARGMTNAGPRWWHDFCPEHSPQPEGHRP